jgi:hypothetical protein
MFCGESRQLVDGVNDREIIRLCHGPIRSDPKHVSLRLDNGNVLVIAQKT